MTASRSADLVTGRLSERGLLALVERVCKKRNVSQRDVVYGRQSKAVVAARDACMAAITARGVSLRELGFIFDMHPTSVRAALQRHAAKG